MTGELFFNLSAVAIEGRALIIDGPPGSGKSSLALALIDRGAGLIGDDGVSFHVSESGQLLASPPPEITGLLEVRGVGLVSLISEGDVPVALILKLVNENDAALGERLPSALNIRSIMGIEVPVLPFLPGIIAPAERAMCALRRWGMCQQGLSRRAVTGSTGTI